MPTFAIDCTIAEARWKDAVPEPAKFVSLVIEFASKYVDFEQTEKLELSVALADNEVVQGLNRDWRGKDKPTNVLSFPSGDEESDLPGMPLFLGDIILAYETVAAEAAEQKKEVKDHLAHLLIHGFLHLLGHDHEDEDEAEEMEAMETLILKDLGIADPYRADAAQK